MLVLTWLFLDFDLDKREIIELRFEEKTIKLP